MYKPYIYILNEINITVHTYSMAESRHVTVQIIRTKTLERNGANSIRRRNSKGKLDKPSIRDQKEKSVNH